jgi:hypothetical protein
MGKIGWREAPHYVQCCICEFGQYRDRITSHWYVVARKDEVGFVCSPEHMEKAAAQGWSMHEVASAEPPIEVLPDTGANKRAVEHLENTLQRAYSGTPHLSVAQHVAALNGEHKGKTVSEIAKPRGAEGLELSAGGVSEFAPGTVVGDLSIVDTLVAKSQKQIATEVERRVAEQVCREPYPTPAWVMQAVQKTLDEGGFRGHVTLCNVRKEDTWDGHQILRLGLSIAMPIDHMQLNVQHVAPKPVSECVACDAGIPVKTRKYPSLDEQVKDTEFAIGPRDESFEQRSKPAPTPPDPSSAWAMIYDTNRVMHEVKQTIEDLEKKVDAQGREIRRAKDKYDP